MWYHPKGIANILSLKTLKKRQHVTYDSKVKDGVFKVHTPQGVVEFFSHENGIHYLDLEKKEQEVIALVTTFRENCERFTKKQVKGTLLGHPSRKNFKSMVHTNLIANCPVTPENISHAH